MPERCASEANPICVSVSGQPVGIDCREAPILTRRGVGIRWRADGGALEKEVRVHPGVTAIGGRTDGEVLIESHWQRQPLCTRLHIAELAVELELQPLVEADAVAAFLASPARPPSPRIAQLDWPLLPASAIELLVEHAPGREILERFAL